MLTHDKGGLHVSADGATLGPAILELEQIAPESTPTIVPNPVPREGAVQQPATLMIERALDRLIEEVQTLRQELADRSLEGRLRRVWAWIQALFRRS